MGKRPESELQVHACRILLEARDLVVRGWSRGATARDGEGRAVDPHHPSARSWSLAGAVEAASARVTDGPEGEPDAKASAIAADALATAIDSEPSEDEGLRRLTRAIRELDGPRAPRDTRGAQHAAGGGRCGVCRRELAQEGLHLISAGQMVGSFCSPHCLAAAEVLAGLQRWAAELDGHGRRDEAEAREALGDELLSLWRRRGGPDPKVVAEAMKLAREREVHRLAAIRSRELRRG
jgi:hypothetical protein